MENLKCGNNMKKSKETSEITELWHYTSVDTVFQIIMGGSLLLSSIEKTKDKEEFKYVFKSYKKQCKTNNNTIDYFQNEEEDTKIMQFLSLSCAKDSASMWYKYGFKGAAIVFDKTKLEEYIKRFKFTSLKEGIPNVTQAISLKRTNYNLEERFEEMQSRKKDIETEDSYNTFSELEKEAHLFKRSKYESEEEFRIMLIADKDGREGQNNITYRDKCYLTNLLEFNNNASKLAKIDRIKIPLDLSIIKSVVLAPNSGFIIGINECCVDVVDRNKKICKIPITKSKLKDFYI